MTLFVEMYGIFSVTTNILCALTENPEKAVLDLLPPRSNLCPLQEKENENFSFGLRRILHSESDFIICWSSRHTSPCEGLMKRQDCFRFHQKAQHALWCLWWSGTTLHFERNLWSPGARCISCVSSRMLERPGWMRAHTPHLPARPHFCRFPASHESDFCTSGSLNTFYFGWVWKINGALGRLHEGCLVSLISRSSNSLKYRVMLNPELQSEDSQKMLQSGSPPPPAVGRAFPFNGPRCASCRMANFENKRKCQITCHFLVNDEEKVITETISTASAPSNAAVLQLFLPKAPT